MHQSIYSNIPTVTLVRQSLEMYFIVLRIERDIAEQSIVMTPPLNSGKICRTNCFKEKKILKGLHRIKRTVAQEKGVL